MSETPKETLDRALSFEPGRGVPIKFVDREARDGYRQRLYSAMASDVRSSKAADDPASPEWGVHRWQEVHIAQVDDLTLWIGRRPEFTVGEPMSLEEAQTRAGGQSEHS